MAALEQRFKASARRGSCIGIQGNPLDEEDGADNKSIKIENLADARPITEEECSMLIKDLKSSM